MEKVLIIGCPGAGKSTFGRKLRDRTGLPLIYLDMLWHKEDQTTVSKEEFDKRLEGVLQGQRWIIDGNYLQTMEKRLQACDTVFLMDFPTEICLEGAESRIGKKREDMPWVEREFDPEFRQWIEEFSKVQLPEIYQLIKKYREKTIVVFTSREEIDQYLDIHQK